MSNLTRNLLSRGMSFAHLAKVPVLASDDAPPPDDKGGKKGKAADDDKGNDDQNTDDGDANGKKGASDDDDPPDDEGEKRDSKSGKKGKAADDKPSENADDDDDEEEMHGSSVAAQARGRERARCASIMGCAAAGKNPVLAANLAFKSKMTRQEAMQVLADTPAAAGAAPTARRNPQLGTGGAPTVTSAQAISASWDRAMQNAQSKKTR